MGVVVVSTVVFILSTMPELTDDIDMILFTNTTDTAASPATAAAPDTPPVERWEEVGCGLELVLQKVPSEVNPKVHNHGEGPY